MRGALERDGRLKRDPARFLALGDSYTIGEGVAAAERWPSQLAELLRAGRIPLQDPQIIARTAWTTDELIDVIAQAPPSGSFNLVSLLIGVNDQYRGRPVDQFVDGFQRLLQHAVAFGKNHAASVVILSIPDWGATPFADGRDRALIAREIDAFNARARAMAVAAGAHWHDVTDASRRMLTNPALRAADGLHPSAAMYRAWAESLVPVARAILAGSRGPVSAA